MIGKSDAQPNSYFQHNPQWLINSTCAVPLPCIKKDTFNYYIQGDTLINSIAYKKIFRKGKFTYFWMAPPPVMCSGTTFYTDSIASFFLRSLGKKMFIKTPLDTNEYLLYDFDLSLGDTLPVTFNNFNSDIYVTHVDSIFTNHGYLKKFTLGGNNTATYLIEGMGSSQGLIEPIGVIFDCGFVLECFSLNDSAWYPAPGNSCNLILGIESSVEDKDFQIHISPNPVSDYCIIQSNKYLSNAEINVINSIGKIVLSENGLSGNELKIRLPKTLSGIYFVQIMMNNTAIHSSKIIVINRGEE